MSKHVAIVSKPSWPPRERAHLTWYYLGERENHLPDTKNMKFALERHLEFLDQYFPEQIVVYPTVYDFFGPNSDVRVLRLNHEPMDYFHSLVVNRFESIFMNPSEFTWKPHISLEDEDGCFPGGIEELTVGKPYISWD